MAVYLDTLVFFDIGTVLPDQENGTRRVSDQDWHDFEEEHGNSGPIPDAADQAHADATPNERDDSHC